MGKVSLEGRKLKRKELGIKRTTNTIQKLGSLDLEPGVFQIRKTRTSMKLGSWGPELEAAVGCESWHRQESEHVTSGTRETYIQGKV